MPGPGGLQMAIFLIFKYFISFLQKASGLID
jgi:hypothetical protein